MNSLSKELIELRDDVEKHHSNIEKWIKYIKELKNQGFKDQALLASQESCLINSSSSELFILYIRLLKELKLLEKRRQALDNYAQNFPNNFIIQLNYGESLRHQKKFSQALEVLEICKQINDKSIWPFIHCSLTLKDLGRLEDSYDDIFRAERIDSRHPRVQLSKGLIEYELGHKKLAIESFERVIAIDPNHSLAVKSALEIVNCVKKDEGEEAALLEVQKHLSMFSENIDIHLVYVKCLLAVQRIDEAYTALRKMLVKWPQNVQSILLMKKLLNRKEQKSEALGFLLNKLSDHSDSFQILSHLGFQYRLMNKRRMALDTFMQAVPYARDDNHKISSLLNIATENMFLGDYQLACEFIEEAKKCNIESERLKLVDAQLKIKLNRPKEAKSIYQNMIDNDQGSIRAINGLANLYSSLGHVDKAVELIHDKLVVNHNNTELKNNLARKLMAINDYDAAIEIFSKVLSENSDNVHAVTGIARCYSNKGEWDRALETLENYDKPDQKRILIQKANVFIGLGRYEEANTLVVRINETYEDFSTLFLQARLLSSQGLFNQSNEILNRIEVESNSWISKIKAAIGNNYFLQYRYKEAAQELRDGILYSENPINLRNRLALIYMINGNLSEAQELHMQSSREIEERNKGGAISIPLRSHSALVINDLRSNPRLFQALMDTFKLKGKYRVRAIADIVSDHPSYLGSSLYLMKELRLQKIFNQLKPGIEPQIPKVIIQYWDQERKPDEITKMMNSWKDIHPNYEHKCYSARTAYEFLQNEYDLKVAEAFTRCEGPAMQADFFRLAYLNKYGGFYADADDMCVNSLERVLPYELVVMQEDFATIGNNFIGVIPTHPTIKIAFKYVLQNLSEYCNENAWFKTGPAILTNALAIYFSKFIISGDPLPPIKVLSISEFRSVVNQQVPLAYKRTNKSWFKNAYKRDIKISV